MKQRFGLYICNDFDAAEAWASAYRAEHKCQVNIRNADLFTPDQKEKFDGVFYDEPREYVVAVYPDAKPMHKPKRRKETE